MTIPVSVAYHRVFNRWVPYEIAPATQHVDTTATLDAKKVANKLTDLANATAGENITAIGLVN